MSLQPYEIAFIEKGKKHADQIINLLSNLINEPGMSDHHKGKYERFKRELESYTNNKEVPVFNKSGNYDRDDYDLIYKMESYINFKVRDDLLLPARIKEAAGKKTSQEVKATHLSSPTDGKPEKTEQAAPQEEPAQHVRKLSR